MIPGLNADDRRHRYMEYLYGVVNEQGHLAGPVNADQNEVAQVVTAAEHVRADMTQVRDHEEQQRTTSFTARQNVLFSGLFICYMEAHSMRRIDEAGSLQHRLYPKLVRKGIPAGNIQQWFAEPTQAPESQVIRFLEPRLAEMVTYLLHQMRGDPERMLQSSAFVQQDLEAAGCTVNRVGLSVAERSRQYFEYLNGVVNPNDQ